MDFDTTTMLNDLYAALPQGVDDKVPGLIVFHSQDSLDDFWDTGIVPARVASHYNPDQPALTPKALVGRWVGMGARLGQPLYSDMVVVEQPDGQFSAKCADITTAGVAVARDLTFEKMAGGYILVEGQIFKTDTSIGERWRGDKVRSNPRQVPHNEADKPGVRGISYNPVDDVIFVTSYQTKEMLPILFGDNTLMYYRVDYQGGKADVVDRDFSGKWRGPLNHNGTVSTVTCELSQNGNAITGTSTTKDHSYSAKFTVQGKARGNNLTLGELDILESSKRPTGWLLKLSNLELSNAGGAMVGTWAGITTTGKPSGGGLIVLRRDGASLPKP